MSGCWIQMDAKIRCVALSNLEAMCERVSGMCHRYWVEEPEFREGEQLSTVKVWYSNPDEYANDEPVYGVFPCWRMNVESEDVVVCLDMIDGSDEGDEAIEVYQSLCPVLDCPELFRDTPDSTMWRTRGEIESTKGQ